MATQLHDTGERFLLENVFESDKAESALPATVDVGLYHDGSVSGDTTNGDDLTDSSDIGDITTEPADGNYARQSVNLDSTGWTTTQPSGAGTPWRAAIDSDVVFDLTNTTGEVDAYFVVVNFDYDDSGTANDHLFWTGDLSQHYSDLSQNDQLTMSASDDAVGVTLD